eukprot:1935663-Karenia_brevis.AAC.1
MATRVQSYDYSTERWAGARLSLKLRVGCELKRSFRFFPPDTKRSHLRPIKRGLREVAVAPGRGKGPRPSRKKHKATEVIAGIALAGQLARTLHR